MTHPDDTAWGRLVATATVGTDTRAVDWQSLPELIRQPAEQLDDADQACLLLDVAALLSTARRAGQQPLTTPPAPGSPAPADARPALRADAARILTLLAQRSTGLLTDALGQIAQRGFRLPDPLLPDFLSAAGRSAELRAATAPVLGRRGEWLAAQNPAWSWTAQHGTDSDRIEDPEVWRTGTLAERSLWFAAARRRDPAAARDLLVDGWAKEAPDDRAPLLELLRPELAMPDEPLLEAALDDRRAAVRELAQDLLAQLPGSRWSRRTAARARDAVRLEHRLLRRRLVITLPASFDEAMRRDGIAAEPTPGATIGVRAFWFEQIVASAPLTSWPLPPAELLGIAAVDRSGADFTLELRQSWQEATIRQRNAEWARALLGTRPPPVERRPITARLLAVLPEAEQLTLISRWLAESDLALLVLVKDVAPWPDALGGAVLTRLKRLPPTDQVAHLGLLPLLARRLPVDHHPEIASTLYELASAPTADNRWRRVLTEAAEIVMLRRRLLEELT